MARHRQPEALAKLKGADKHDPQRYRKKAPASKQKLGAAPSHLTAEVAKTWKELERYSLKDVLTGADRLVLEVTANLVAEFRADPPGFPAAKLGHLVGCLARLGLTPADRQKLGVERPPEGNKFDEF